MIIYYKWKTCHLIHIAMMKFIIDMILLLNIFLHYIYNDNFIFQFIFFAILFIYICIMALISYNSGIALYLDRHIENFIVLILLAIYLIIFYVKIREITLTDKKTTLAILNFLSYVQAFNNIRSIKAFRIFIHMLFDIFRNLFLLFAIFIFAVFFFSTVFCILTSIYDVN